MERINIDPPEGRAKKLHPTLKKCACGWIGTKTGFYDHIDDAEASEDSSAKEFWTKHGEVPCNVDDPEVEEYTNIHWMKGQHPNYND
jgi:hypothetical protein